MNDVVIQEFLEEEVIAQQQVEAVWAKLEAFKAELVIHEWLGTSHKWVLGAYWPLTKFWRVLGCIWPILGLRQLAKEEVQHEAKNKEARPILRSILGFWVDVMGKGFRPVGLPMFRPIL